VTKNEMLVMDWLMGSRPDLDGKWFGECECCDHKPRFWWRRHLTKMLQRIKSNKLTK